MTLRCTTASQSTPRATNTCYYCKAPIYRTVVEWGAEIHVCQFHYKTLYRQP